eukprot:scaffold310_cov307-Pinguiococcus_pyrenoidosus.AAC.3
MEFAFRARYPLASAAEGKSCAEAPKRVGALRLRSNLLSTSRPPGARGCESCICAFWRLYHTLSALVWYCGLFCGANRNGALAWRGGLGWRGGDRRYIGTIISPHPSSILKLSPPNFTSWILKSHCRRKRWRESRRCGAFVAQKTCGNRSRDVRNGSSFPRFCGFKTGEKREESAEFRSTLLADLKNGVRRSAAGAAVRLAGPSKPAHQAVSPMVPREQQTSRDARHCQEPSVSQKVSCAGSAPPR